MDARGKGNFKNLVNRQFLIVIFLPGNFSLDSKEMQEIGADLFSLCQEQGTASSERHNL